MYKNIIILGSTGSIGTQSLEVCKKHNINVVALSANKNTQLLKKQVLEFSPEFICITDEEVGSKFKEENKDLKCKILIGKQGLEELAKLKSEALVLNAVVGIAGLKATLAALNSKKDVALANKESLVTAGKLVMKAAKDNNVKLLPVDSEHSAIFQCMQDNHSAKSLKRVILTASGGPFFGYSKKELLNVTKAQALKHPNWEMGSKITIDSATLMNKGLELIEAAWLFDLKAEDIEVVVHRQSIIHSAVEFSDNSIIAQMGTPDMQIPIQYAITYPERYESNAKQLDFFSMGDLTFHKPDIETFLCLKAAIKAINLGGLYPCLINGVNERAVELFLNDKIEFADIGRIVYKSIENFNLEKEYTLEEVFKIDEKAREFVDLQI